MRTTLLATAVLGDVTSSVVTTVSEWAHDPGSVRDIDGDPEYTSLASAPITVRRGST